MLLWNFCLMTPKINLPPQLKVEDSFRRNISRVDPRASSSPWVWEEMTFKMNIKIFTLHLCLIHDHTSAIIQQLFWHFITLLQLPCRLLPPATLPLHALTHWKARLDLADRLCLLTVTIDLAFWHNGCAWIRALIFPTMLSRACWDSEEA